MCFFWPPCQEFTCNKPIGSLAFSPSVSKNINAQTVIFCNQYLTSNNVAPKARQKTIGPAKSVSFMMLPSATFNGWSTVSVFCQMWSKLIPNSTNYMKRIMHIYFIFSLPVTPIYFTFSFPCLSTFKSPDNILCRSRELSHSIFPQAAKHSASTDRRSQMLGKGVF